ncbi:transporter [Balneolaceae bacterium YR4-1]|uniref:Transporter n=1 Tax=Halalkalibaculum roseum TaxID=2709311 RepID=A0A6M1SYJ2_9BACT|nr:transporter [Halalkalibaculum roseum]NGP76254.1 transporter [Halalkalibaculum roseum]
MDITIKSLTMSIVITGLLLGAGCVKAQQVSYSGSIQYATGSYFFDESTQSFSLANGLNISGDNITVSFNVPFIVQNSPWLSYGVAGYIPTGGPDHKTVRDSSGHGQGQGGQDGRNKLFSTAKEPNNMRNKMSDDPVVLPDTSNYKQSSFGDPNVYMNLKLYSSASEATSLQLNSGLKIPLADPTNGFGTGEWDYGLGLSLSQRLGNFFVLADFMKWWFGDLPDLELKDPLTYTVGVSKMLGTGKWMINTTYSGYTEIISGYEPPRTLNLGLGYFLSQRVSLNGTMGVGLSESSSDFSLGLGWMIRL